MEWLEKKLKLSKEGQALLSGQLIDQELLTRNALGRVDQLATRGIRIISQDCKIAFSIGFVRCKAMARMHLPTDSVELLQANF